MSATSCNHEFVNIYHEVASDSLASVLANGIIKTSRGAKGDNSAIKETDIYLDEKLPGSLKEKDISRDNNIYGYIGAKNRVIDIKDGQWIPLKQKQVNDGHILLEIKVDPTLCYVSNLDTYDALKYAIESNQPEYILKRLAARYWKTLTPLGSFSIGAIERPEVMITYNIPPDQITII